MCTFLPESRIGRGRSESDGTLTAGACGRGPRTPPRGRMCIEIDFLVKSYGQNADTGGRRISQPEALTQLPFAYAVRNATDGIRKAVADWCPLGTASRSPFVPQAFEDELADDAFLLGIPEHRLALAVRFDAELDRHHRRRAEFGVAVEHAVAANDIEKSADLVSRGSSGKRTSSLPPFLALNSAGNHR